MSVSYWNPEAAECTISLEMTDGNGDIIGSVIRHLKVNKIRGKSEVELENSEQHAICVDAAHPEEKEFRFSLDISFVDGSTETYDPSEEGTAGSDENDEESSTNLLDRLKRLSKRMSSMHILVGCCSNRIVHYTNCKYGCWYIMNSHFFFLRLMT